MFPFYFSLIDLFGGKKIIFESFVKCSHKGRISLCFLCMLCIYYSSICSCLTMEKKKLWGTVAGMLAGDHYWLGMEKKKKSRKKVLDSDTHAISAANTSSQLKLLVKGVRAEEMHLPNWMLDLQAINTSDLSHTNVPWESSAVPSGLLSLLLSSYLFNWKKLIEWKWSTKLVLILLMELSSWPCLEKDIKLDFRKDPLMLALNLMG